MYSYSAGETPHTRRSHVARVSYDVSYDQTHVTPLVSWSFFCVLMALNIFTKLPLPASVSVPAGAINPLAADESCLMRSQHTVPLKQQHATFNEEAVFYEDERSAAEYPLLHACFISNLFDEPHYRLQPEDGVHLGVGHRVGNLDLGRRCHDRWERKRAWNFTFFRAAVALNDLAPSLAVTEAS